jgi:hypothetical protein
MKLPRLLNYGPEKLLAQQLADLIAEKIPPKLMSERRNIISPNKITRVLESAYAIAKEHQDNVGTGFFRRAVIANSFKWALHAKTYSDDFIDVATEGLVVELSRTPKQKRKSGVR